MLGGRAVAAVLPIRCVVIIVSQQIGNDVCILLHDM